MMAPLDQESPGSSPGGATRSATADPGGGVSLSAGGNKALARPRSTGGLVGFGCAPCERHERSGEAGQAPPSPVFDSGTAKQLEVRWSPCGSRCGPRAAAPAARRCPDRALGAHGAPCPAIPAHLGRRLGPKARIAAFTRLYWACSRRRSRKSSPIECPLKSVNSPESKKVPWHTGQDSTQMCGCAALTIRTMSVPSVGQNTFL
jgi:hypothetical protein